MITVDFLVEEPSMEEVLYLILPPLLKDRANYRVVNFGSKSNMLRRLPDRLRAYRRRVDDEEVRVVVLIDEDRKNCFVLKEGLEKIAFETGLATKSRPARDGSFCVVNRIVIEELEAWFFGDIAALCSAYSRVPRDLDRKASFRDPDAIRGGTWERLGAELRKAGYYPGIYPKVEAARMIAQHMVPQRNVSRSFQAFLSGLEALLSKDPRSSAP